MSIFKNRTYILFLMIFTVFNCKIQNVDQPAFAHTNDIISVSLEILDDIGETTNPHKGILGVLIPESWETLSVNYSSSINNGVMFSAPNWADSIEIEYPANEMGNNYKWLGFISDSGFIYSSPFIMIVNLKIKTSDIEGCFNLGYLVTKATKDLIGNEGWAPLSYPNRIGIPDTNFCKDYREIEVEPAPNWGELFDRKEGWTGADGIYSVPINGLEIQNNSSDQKTLLIFSDTFIGEVDSNDQRKNTKMIHNSYAVLTGHEPLNEQIEFFWNGKNEDEPKTVFVPNTNNSNPGDWYWLMDGISLNDSIYIYAMRLKTTDNFFDPVGVSLISFPVDSIGTFNKYDQVDAPIFYEDSNTEIIFGQAIMPLTERSENIMQDGYIYLYGPKSGDGSKKLVAARFFPQDISNFSEYEFWNGNYWGSDISQCADITNNISMEFSVTPIAQDKFMLAFQLGTASGNIAIRFGESPIGPFDFYEKIYQCPEVDSNLGIFTYNAKAHPHLSNENELLISYNVNTTIFSNNSLYADIYRPRFITMDISEFVSSTTTASNAESYILSTYPNPFNGQITIKYQINNSSKMKLVIYNILGQKITILENKWKNKGIYFTSWDGTNDYGKEVTSGIYLAVLTIENESKINKVSTNKLVYIK